MKLTKFKDPLTGEKDDILNIEGLLQRVIGVIVFLAVLAIGQKGAKAVEDASRGTIDTSPQLSSEKEVTKQGIRTF